GGHLLLSPPSLCKLAPQMPPLLEEVALRALAKSPDDRFSCALAMAKALAPLGPGRAPEEARVANTRPMGVSATPSPSLQPPPPAAPRHTPSPAVPLPASARPTRAMQTVVPRRRGRAFGVAAIGVLIAGLVAVAMAWHRDKPPEKATVATSPPETKLAPSSE